MDGFPYDSAVSYCATYDVTGHHARPTLISATSLHDALSRVRHAHGGCYRGTARRWAERKSPDTGGGVVCVVVECEEGGEIAWGLAGDNWGASVTDEDDEYVSGIQTECPGDIAKIVEALKRPSLSHGARLQPA